jgi:hypothetical protein
MVWKCKMEGKEWSNCVSTRHENHGNTDGKRTDEWSYLVRTFEGFLCFILNCTFLLKLLSSTPTAGDEHSYLHPGECGFRLGSIMTCVSIACM